MYDLVATSYMCPIECTIQGLAVQCTEKEKEYKRKVDAWGIL